MTVVAQKNLTSRSPKPKMIKEKLQLRKPPVLHFLRSRFVDIFRGLPLPFCRACQDKYLIIIKSSINKYLIKIILRASNAGINLILGLQPR
jgi:hypothetical protein